MARFFSLILVLVTFFKTSDVALADVSGLVLCKDSAVYKRRLEGSVKKLNARLANYEPGTPAYLALEQQINQTKTRFAKYANQQAAQNALGELSSPGFLYLQWFPLLPSHTSIFSAPHSPQVASATFGRFANCFSAKASTLI